MNDARYIYREEPISREEAQRRRRDDLERMWEHAWATFRQNMEEITELRQSPLPESITVQITLNPGDEGYDEAPVRMDPLRYQGDFQWITSMPVKP